MMMKKALIIILILVLAAAGYVAYSRHIANRDITITAFGDSLVEGKGSREGGGFVTLLAQDIGHPIINLGHSGDTTRDALKRIGEVTKAKPDITIVLLGGNDFLQGIPEEETFKNLGAIIKALQHSGSKVLLLGLESDLHPALDRAYFGTLVAQYNVAYVPNILEGIWGHPTLMSDALHPNDEGYALIASRVKSALEAAL